MFRTERKIMIDDSQWTVDRNGNLTTKMNGSRYLVSNIELGKYEARRDGHWLGDYPTQKLAITRCVSVAYDFRSV